MTRMISGEGRAFELVRVPGGDREAWLGIRRQGVGGSDVAAIMGLSRYRGALSVYMEKLGIYEPEDISDRPAVHWGNVLEPVVGHEYAERHPEREIRRVNAVCRSIARPWAQASLDYEVRDPGLGWGVLEIKTAGLRSAGDWEDGVPVYYQTQVAHYLSVTQRPFADVAVLIGGSDYREYRLMRDADDEAAVVGAVDGFWADVLAGNPPEAGPTAQDAAAVVAANRDATDEVEEVEESDAMREWLAARHERDTADELLRQATSRLKAEIGTRRGLSCPRGRFTWSRGKATRLDSKRLREEEPEVYERFCVESDRDGGIRFTPARKKRE